MNAALGPFPGIQHPCTVKCIERLKQGKPNELISRDQMAGIIGRECSPGDPGYANVNSAINQVEKGYGIVWRWDKTAKAWRCLDDAGKIGVAKGGISRARKIATRSLRVSSCVNHETLSSDAKQAHNLNVAVAGMLAIAASGSFRKTLAQEGQLSQPNVMKLLSVMKTNNG